MSLARRVLVLQLLLVLVLAAVFGAVLGGLLAGHPYGADRLAVGTDDHDLVAGGGGAAGVLAHALHPPRSGTRRPPGARGRHLS